MELGLALTLCGLGAGFLIPAFIITGISEGRKKKCTEDTTALINIKYNPQKPGQSYIQGYDNKVYRILSSVFMVMGMIPILICLGIWIFG